MTQDQSSLGEPLTVVVGTTAEDATKYIGALDGAGEFFITTVEKASRDTVNLLFDTLYVTAAAEKHPAIRKVTAALAARRQPVDPTVARPPAPPAVVADPWAPPAPTDRTAAAALAADLLGDGPHSADDVIVLAEWLLGQDEPPEEST